MINVLIGPLRRMLLPFKNFGSLCPEQYSTCILQLPGHLSYCYILPRTSWLPFGYGFAISQNMLFFSLQPWFFFYPPPPPVKMGWACARVVSLRGWPQGRGQRSPWEAGQVAEAQEGRSAHRVRGFLYRVPRPNIESQIGLGWKGP